MKRDVSVYFILLALGIGLSLFSKPIGLLSIGMACGWIARSSPSATEWARRAL